MMAAHTTVEISWAEIENLTQLMWNAASSENWMEVVDLASQRHKDLVAHFSSFPVGPGNASFYQQHLSRMLKGEEELQKLTLQARKQLMREGVDLQRQRKAVGAYLS